MRRTLPFLMVLTLLSALASADEAEDAAVKFITKLKGKVTRHETKPGKPVIGVDLEFKRVTGAELKQLVALKELQKLNLSWSTVADSDLKVLAALTQLKVLDLRQTRVTDAGLKELASLKQLQTLVLTATKITDAGLKELAALEHLRELSLMQTKVTDSGMRHLAALKQLHKLNLRRTKVTDAGLKELATLKQLQTLNLGARVTAAGVTELRKALPGCNITAETGFGPKPALPNAPQRTIDLEIAHTYDGPVTMICVPLSLSKEDAAKHELLVEILDNPKNKSQFLGQLTAPGLLTEHIKPAAAGLVRRDLHFRLAGPFLKFKAGTVTKAQVQLNKKPFFVGYGFRWTYTDGEYAELALNYGKMPVLRYLHKAYDNSSKEKRDQTCKVFYHLYSFKATKDRKDSPYAHPHDLLYAFNKITFDGKECDTWHAQPGDTHQAHSGFLVKEEGREVARQRVAIDWHGPKNEIFAKEEREITAYNLGPRGTLLEFVSRLKTRGGLVKLRGDPQHAGFQFRAHNDMRAQNAGRQTYFRRSDGKGEFGETRSWDPKTKKGPINLAWDGCSFVIDGKRYTVAYLNHPRNPGESRWGESADGRVGCYFEYDLTEKNPLVVNYRVWLQNGEMKVEQIEALSKAFREPPKVTVKYPPQ